MAEQVRRIVFILHRHKPLVIRPVSGLDALSALVGLQADLVNLVAVYGEGTHHFRQLARPPDIDVVYSGIEPTP